MLQKVVWSVECVVLLAMLVWLWMSYLEVVRTRGKADEKKTKRMRELRPRTPEDCLNHGFFEFLQGNKPTSGLVIQAIGEAQRFWVEGTEEAFTIIPNFLISGLLSMGIGVSIIIWSLRFIETQHGRSVFLGLFILLFLVGGGIGQLVFFIPAWAFATRMNKPLTWWKKVLPRNRWAFLSRLWPITLTLSTISILIGLEIAIFGFFPGTTDPQALQNTAMIFVLASALLNIVSFIAGFGHDLLRMEQFQPDFSR